MVISAYFGHTVHHSLSTICDAVAHLSTATSAFGSKFCQDTYVPESAVTTAMQATDPATVLEHKLYVRQPSSLDKGHWGVGQVTLAGDSAHPMRPTNGEASFQSSRVDHNLAMCASQNF